MQLLSGYVGSTPEVKDLVEGWRSIVQFDLMGEEPFYIICEGQRAEFHEGLSDNADVVLSGRSEVFFDVITGKLDPDRAYMMKKYAVKGSVVDAMKFRRVSEIVEQSHKSMFSVLKTLGKVAFR